MATILNNFATLTYNSGEDTEAATSNVVSTNLLESAGVSAEKFTANSTWRPGENLTYFVTVTNTGTEPIENVTVTDDLGGETDTPMFYVQGSARVIAGIEVTEVTPTDTNPLVIPVADTLLPGESVIVLYVARVNATIEDDVNSITNTATAQGEGTACGGGDATDESSVTLPREDFAQVNLLKAVDKAVISCGDTLTYTFSIENSGNIPATNVVITDTLPEGFVITSVQSVTNGVTTVYDEGDYTVSADNTLILPTGAGVTITVPARTDAGNGLTTVIVTGIVTG
ncbi:MAG: DUF11 domain-containing protein [Ruminococcus sp.]|nr:DUF11 domain-containing protein [Ruminococcus sp.]